MFYSFLVGLILIYIVYYAVILLFDIKNINKQEKADGEGEDVDISASVANYTPIDASEIIGSDSPNTTMTSTYNNETSDEEVNNEAFADATDYSQFGADNSVVDPSSDFLDNPTGDTDSDDNNHSFDEEYTDEEDLDDDNIGGRGRFIGDNDNEAETEDVPMGIKGGYSAVDLESMFREEYAKVNEHFAGMRVTVKS